MQHNGGPAMFKYQASRSTVLLYPQKLAFEISHRHVLMGFSARCPNEFQATRTSGHRVDYPTPTITHKPPAAVTEFCGTRVEKHLRPQIKPGLHGDLAVLGEP